MGSPHVPDPRSDEELVEAVNAGDASALEALYVRYRDWVVRLAYRTIGETGTVPEVAAALVLGALLVHHAGTLGPPERGARPAATRADIDRSGRVDILDAFALARRLETRGKPRAEWDMNGDGSVDRTDVDLIAMAAVRLERGSFR